jgi:two-component system sensor histidine kinase DctS
MDAMRNSPRQQRVITLSVRRNGDQVEIDVADTGVGIAAEDADRLFEPFYTTKPEGMGMGLNICRSVVEAHDGRLWHEPNAGGGSIFKVLLPSHGR